MECKRKSKNLERCGCSYSSCSRRGICCECLHYHLAKKELPGCFFPPYAEKTYNRSLEYFISIFSKKPSLEDE